MMQSLVEDGRQLGWLPKWPLANGETGQMDGDSADAMLANAWAFGARGFDARVALSLMENDANMPGRSSEGYVERPGLRKYLRLGYVPTPSGKYGAASTSLEYALDDFAIGRLAAALGDLNTGDAFTRRAQTWDLLLNPENGFIEPVSTQGKFPLAFDPTSERGFVEGNAWEYSWWVPYNLRALFRAMGGDRVVIKRLNALFSHFASNADTRFAWLGNEPSLEIPWMYDYTSQPWRTQALLRRIVSTLYPRAAYGLPGNDDLGTMSAWLVWADLGLYPAIPGVDALLLSAPMFPRVEIRLAAGHLLRILAPGAGPGNPYIHDVTLGRQKYERAFVWRSALVTGGAMHFRLGHVPDLSWNSKPADAPPAFPLGEAPALGFIDRVREAISLRGRGVVQVGVRNAGETALSIRWRIAYKPQLLSVPGQGGWRLAPGGTGTQSIRLEASPALHRGAYNLKVRFEAKILDPRGRTTWIRLPSRWLQVVVR
jgi:predicted alpha-1,2-mannosidase